MNLVCSCLFPIAEKNSDDEGYSREQAEQKAKRERESMIKKEFQSRRGKLTRREEQEREREKKKDEEDALRSAKVRGAEFTSKKIAGLEVRARESYLSLLETNLRSNYNQFVASASSGEEPPRLSPLDVQKVAVAEEFRIFSQNKVITTYRRGMAFLMAAVKKDTDGWRLHEAIRSYEPDAPQWSGGVGVTDSNKNSGGSPHQEAEEDNKVAPPSAIAGPFQSALQMSRKMEEGKWADGGSGSKKKADPVPKGLTPINMFLVKGKPDADLASPPASSTSSSSDRVKSRWKSLGLSDDSDDEEGEGGFGGGSPRKEVPDSPAKTTAERPRVSLNFYCDTQSDEEREDLSQKAKTNHSAHQMSPSASSSSSSPDVDAFCQKQHQERSPALAEEEEEDRNSWNDTPPDLDGEEENEVIAEEVAAFRQRLEREAEPLIALGGPAEGEGDMPDGEERSAKLMDSILRVQQQMAEGEDQMRYEMRLQREEEKKRKEEEKEKEVEEAKVRCKEKMSVKAKEEREGRSQVQLI